MIALIVKYIETKFFNFKYFQKDIKNDVNK